ncbi:MAG: hypothetical protein QOF98_3715 [Streptomyces sp.]|jgi:hypothetical protein|nr:hypothetical protein [Streptomyces sp.]
MPHFLVVAALVLAAWAMLSLPLGVLVGRRLKHVNPRALPAGCAFRTAAEGGPAVLGPAGAEPSVPDGSSAGAVPGCTAQPCRASPRPAAGARSCAGPRAGHRGFGRATG